MRRMAKLWKSCLDGSKHWQTAKRAAWKERHLLFLRSKVGWEKKVSPSSIHISVLLQLPLCSYLCSIPTCVMSLAIAWLHSLHVWSSCTCRSCVLLHMPYMKVVLVIRSRAINSSLGFYLCKLMNYNFISFVFLMLFFSAHLYSAWLEVTRNPVLYWPGSSCAQSRKRERVWRPGGEGCSLATEGAEKEPELLTSNPGRHYLCNLSAHVVLVLCYICHIWKFYLWSDTEP